jgi:hypothetical protein
MRIPSNTFASVFIIAISVSLVTMSFMHSALAQNPTNPDKNTIKGSITSNTNNGTTSDPAWILGGVYKFSNINSSSPVFNATFYMAKLDGTAEHTHSIYDFKLAGNPTTDSVTNSTTYNGTSTVTMKEKPATNVPTQIITHGDSAIAISLDPKATKSHFGTSQIFGTQHLICVEQPELCK